MSTVSEVSLDEIHGITRRRDASRKTPMEFRCGIFDLNDEASRLKYQALVTAEGVDGKGTVEITLRKDRWAADGRFFIVVSWWQPFGVGDLYVPAPVDLVRNAVLQRNE